MTECSSLKTPVQLETDEKQVWGDSNHLPIEVPRLYAELFTLPSSKTE